VVGDAGPFNRSSARCETRRKTPIDIHLDFEAEAVDEIRQRLSELRTHMEPPPGRQ
jgi:hypothetical protein